MLVRTVSPWYCDSSIFISCISHQQRPTIHVSLCVPTSLNWLTSAYCTYEHFGIFREWNKNTNKYFTLNYGQLKLSSRKGCCFQSVTCRQYMMMFQNGQKKTIWKWIPQKLMIYFTKNPVFPPLITIDCDEIERVGQSKLLGIQVTDDLKWQKHIDTIYSKAARKLYTIIMLSKAGLKQEDLVLVYITRIQPILEYTCQLCTQGLHKNILNAWNQ